MTTTTLIILSSCAAAALACVLTGCLKARAFEHSPKRTMGFDGLELVVALGLMFAGILTAHALLGPSNTADLQDHQQDPQHPQTAPASTTQSQPAPGPRQYLRDALAWQGLVQLPVVVFVGLRCATRRDGWRTLGLWPKHPLRDSAAGLLGLAMALPMALGLSVIMISIGEHFLGVPAPQIGHDMLEVLFEPAESWVRVALFLSAVGVAPVLEEIIFRALMQTALAEMLGWERRWAVVLIASAVFAAVHVGQPWQVLPSLFVLAVVLGWVYERSGSLVGPVVIHAGFNAINVALAGV